MATSNTNFLTQDSYQIHPPKDQIQDQSPKPKQRQNLREKHLNDWLKCCCSIEESCRKGHDGCAYNFINKKFNGIHTRNQYNETLLHITYNSRYPEIVYFLIKNGLNVNSKDVENKTPLHHACFRGNTIIVKALIDCGAYINSVDILNNSPLHYASSGGFDDIVFLLLNKGALILSNKETPIHKASLSGHFRTVNILISYFPAFDINSRDDLGQTSLYLAVRGSHYNVAALLISFGAKNLSSFNGRAPADICSDKDFKKKLLAL